VQPSAKAAIEKERIHVSDQERDKHGHRDADGGTDDDVSADVEAHKHGHRDADSSTDDDSNDVEAHKHGGKDS
jgi:hypothetical protein